jgi:peptide/nickel transport system substrate-binding protein
MKRALAAVLAACLSLPALAQPLPTLRLAINEDPDAMDPTVARTFTGRIVFAALCDKLVDIDEKLTIVPQLATAYAWLDPKTLEFKLRPGVLFHDGTKMDAEAVKYSLLRHLTMAGSTRRGEIAALDTVEIVDPLTVRLHLKAANAPFLSQLADRAGMIVSPKAAEAAGKDFSLKPVCAGPFRYTERVPQDRIVLDRFPDYWNAAAIKLGRIVYRPIPDNTVKLANLQAGALDMAERFLPPDVEVMKKDPKLKVVISGNLGYQSLTFNIANGKQPRTPMMADARVRQAFALSIDRQALIDVVYSGLYTPIAQAVPPESPFYAADVKPQPRDVAKAKALLAAAGVKTPVSVELLTSNSPDQRQTGEVIQSMAAEAGFDVKLRTTEFVTALKASDEGDYEVFLIGWSGRVDEDGNLYSFVKTKGPLNAGLYSDATVDDLLEQARAVTDIPARRAIYGKLAVKLNQDLPLMYVYTPKAIVGMSTKVSGFVPIADNLIRPQGITIAP